MEQPSPLGQGATLTRRRNATGPVAALVTGFTCSALVVFGAATLVGAALGLDRLPLAARLTVAALLGAGMVAVDLTSLRAPHFCRLTLRRQTPKALSSRYGPRLGALLWGVDTGVAVTTIRMSAAAWVVLTLGVLGLAPWWVGLAYAVGFSVPLAVATLLLPWRPVVSGTAVGEPLWVQRALTHARPAIQVACLAVLLAVTGVLGVSAAADLDVIGLSTIDAVSAVSRSSQ